MLNWAWRTWLVMENSLAHLRQLPEHVDRRETSRALTVDEFDRLIENTPDKMRQLYYLFSGRCGLRWSEIRCLEWEDLDLAKGLIHLRPEATKSRRPDVIDVPADLLDRLRRMGEGRSRIFGTTPVLRTFKMDLMRASIPYEVGGQQADRKCLRKTYCTHLALTGADLWAAVKLMRHRDPKLTVRVYTDLGVLDTRADVARLSGNSRSASESVSSQAVGWRGPEGAAEWASR